jgi:uncharacterized protein YbjT (DUF2867 family)
MIGAEVVIDVSNPPTGGRLGAVEFFSASGTKIAEAKNAAGVKRHVVLSVVGAERLATGDYFRGKVVQEDRARQSGNLLTIVRSTQFFEFLPAIADASTDGGTVRLPPTLVQPIAADDVCDALAQFASQPVAGTFEVAGPNVFQLSDAVGRFLAASGDPRRVVADADARYFGVRLGERTLMPGGEVRVTTTQLDEVLAARYIRNCI